jgi:hypothetical protein
VEIPGSGKVKFYANKHVGVEVRRVPTQARDQSDPLPASRLCDIARKKCTASRAVGLGPGTTAVVARHGWQKDCSIILR